MQDCLQRIKRILPAEDVLTYPFKSADGVCCAVIYADGMINKQVLGELVILPLERANIKEELAGGEQKDGLFAIRSLLYFPELLQA